MLSKHYLKQLDQLHQLNKGFGGKVKKLGEFHSYMQQWRPKTLLDYGCGRAAILNDLVKRYPECRCYGYDPAVVAYQNIALTSYECVFSNDVLEHIEPEYVNDVLTHINDLSSRYIWLRIDTRPARKQLSDGRNAHLILESPDWWRNCVKQCTRADIVYENYNSKGKFDLALVK